MNIGKLNHRLRFAQLSNGPVSPSGGYSVIETPCVCSTSTPTDQTWGSCEPYREYHQKVMEADATVLNSSRLVVIRYRNMWQPLKDMIFEDMNTPGDIYTIHSVTPYYPGAKVTFQSSQDTVYKDKEYVFILGTKRE
jgi:hypothetical protein